MSHKSALTQARWHNIKTEMRAILIGLARMRRSIAYSDLAALVQTAYIHYRAPAFGWILHEIAREDEAEGRPGLAVLVVNKTTGICGAGFFKEAAARGFDVSDPVAFWRSQFEQVCDYWGEVEDDAAR